MSGPGGSETKRDERRMTRQQQFQQRQAERAEARRRELQRRQQIRWGLIGGGILIAVIVIVLISMAVLNANRKHSAVVASPSPTILLDNGLQAYAVTGQPIDGMTCQAEMTAGTHIHQYLDLYINGKRVDATGGVGIPTNANCLYPLHVHYQEDDIIHNESGTAQTFTLGQFFDVWGVKLSSAQVAQFKVDSTHKLVVEIVDQSGKVTTYTGNPYNLPLHERDTIYVLYNSPNITPVSWSGWATFNG